MSSPSKSDPHPLPLLREMAVRGFVAAGAIPKMVAVGRRGGFELQIHMGDATATLGNTRGGIRLFGSMESLIGLLQRLGVRTLDVDITEFAPAPLRDLRDEITSGHPSTTD